MKLVIFDLDDTLIDFASTRQLAYARMGDLLMREGLDAASYLRVCPDVDRALFSQFETGLISRADYRVRRFAEPFAHMAVVPRDGLVDELNRVFMDCVNDEPLVFDDVHATLASLRAQGTHTAILTNGPSDGQRRKLRATGLQDAVDHVAIGEELGVSKPAQRAFHSVTEHFELPHSAAALMVGDSPQLDYDAALNAGLMALLLDRPALHSGSGRTSIRSLAEILSR